MVGEVARICQLPSDVAAQIKSAASIPSLDEAVLGLVKNSLDARARKINVRVDYVRGCCSAEDDGDGIAPREFSLDGGLGRSHCWCHPFFVPSYKLSFSSKTPPSSGAPNKHTATTVLFSHLSLRFLFCPLPHTIELSIQALQSHFTIQGPLSA